MKKNGMYGYCVCFFILFCPRSVYAEEFVSTKNGLDVMFVMDYSGSMKTNDFAGYCKGDGEGICRYRTQCGYPRGLCGIQ